MINVEVENDLVNLQVNGEMTAGLDGENGATFLPSVDTLGNISWTNDKGLPNPTTRNIKGQTGDTGATGVGISSITKTATVGLVDTYTITYTNSTTSTFDVTNGSEGDDGVGIASITKTATAGLIDTYTITYTDGTTSTFNVTNGANGQDGQDGEDGAAAGFGSVTASVDNNTGTPSVVVTTSGPDTAKNFDFAFHNLKGSSVSASATGTSTDTVGYITIDGVEKKLNGGVTDVQVDSESIVVEGVANLNSDDFGKVDDVKVNGSSVVTSKVANVTVPTQASDIGAVKQVNPMTYAEYQALPSSKLTDHTPRYITDVGTTPFAYMVGYSNSSSGLSATDVQGAIDEVVGGLGNVASLSYSVVSQW